MNPHIELVKKWLADSNSVTEEELEANEGAAEADYRAADWADVDAARAAYRAASWAADAGYGESCKQKAIEAITKYEELPK